MKIAVRVVTAATAIALAMPIAAMAQYTGVSHPDETPIMNNPDTGEQVYTPKKTPVLPEPELKPSPMIPIDQAPKILAENRPTEAMISVRASSAPDIDAGIVTRIPGRSNELPVGSLMKVKLAEDISAETTPTGAKFTGHLVEGVERDGHVLVPAGSQLSGYVTSIRGGKGANGIASIRLKTSTLTLPDGTQYMVRGQVIDTDIFKAVRVGREGTIYRRDHPVKTAGTIALATGSGAAAGALVGGVPGALIGAGVGAGVSTAVLIKHNRPAELPSETRITFSLVAPLVVGN